MSIRIPVDILSDEQKNKIDNNLCITLKTTYGIFEKTKELLYLD